MGTRWPACARDRGAAHPRHPLGAHRAGRRRQRGRGHHRRRRGDRAQRPHLGAARRPGSRARRRQPGVLPPSRRRRSRRRAGADSGRARLRGRLPRPGHPHLPAAHRTGRRGAVLHRASLRHAAARAALRHGAQRYRRPRPEGQRDRPVPAPLQARGAVRGLQRGLRPAVEQPLAGAGRVRQQHDPLGVARLPPARLLPHRRRQLRRHHGQLRARHRARADAAGVGGRLLDVQAALSYPGGVPGGGARVQAARTPAVGAGDRLPPLAPLGRLEARPRVLARPRGHGARARRTGRAHHDLAVGDGGGEQRELRRAPPSRPLREGALAAPRRGGRATRRERSRASRRPPARAHAAVRTPPTPTPGRSCGNAGSATTWTWASGRSGSTRATTSA